jgi:hypothetical protein
MSIYWKKGKFRSSIVLQELELIPNCCSCVLYNNYNSILPLSVWFAEVINQCYITCVNLFIKSWLSCGWKFWNLHNGYMLCLLGATLWDFWQCVSFCIFDGRWNYEWNTWELVLLNKYCTLQSTMNFPLFKHH